MKLLIGAASSSSSLAVGWVVTTSKDDPGAAFREKRASEATSA
jgi:hypothetical protein